MIFCLSLTLPLRHSLPLYLLLSLSRPSRSHLIIPLFLDAFMSSLLHLSHSLCPEISTAPPLWFSFLPSCETFDLLHITNRDIIFLHVSFCRFPSFSLYLTPLPLSAGAQNRLAADSCGVEVKALSIREELVAQSIDRTNTETWQAGLNGGSAAALILSPP